MAKIIRRHHPNFSFVTPKKKKKKTPPRPPPFPPFGARGFPPPGGKKKSHWQGPQPTAAAYGGRKKKIPCSSWEFLQSALERQRSHRQGDESRTPSNSGRINQKYGSDRAHSGNTASRWLSSRRQRPEARGSPCPKPSPRAPQVASKILGARLVLTEGAKGMKAPSPRPRSSTSRFPTASSSSNSPIHPTRRSIRKTTAEEIWRDNRWEGRHRRLGHRHGRATITGVGEVLKSRKPSVKIVAVEPDAFAGPLRRPAGPAQAAGDRPRLSLPAVLTQRSTTEIIRVKETDSGPVSKQVNKLDGIPIGISSGAATWAALQLAKTPGKRGQGDRRDHSIEQRTPNLSTWLFADLNVESDNVDDLIGAPSSSAVAGRVEAGPSFAVASANMPVETGFAPPAGSLPMQSPW